jgi:DNA-binding PadR family transcriptional regulator
MTTPPPSPSRASPACSTNAAASPCARASSRIRKALTDGNLNRHLHALAEEGIVATERVKSGGRPSTRVTITPAGRERFMAYVDELENVVRAVHERANAANGLRLRTSS